MGALIGILISVAAIFGLLMDQFHFFNYTRRNIQLNAVERKVADQIWQVFAASYKFMQTMNAQPSTWSISTLVNSNVLPATFFVQAPDGSYRDALGQTYSIYYATDTCNQNVMDLVIKVNDPEDAYNKIAWQRAGVNQSSLGRVAIYSQIISTLYNQYKNQFSQLDMKNPCNTDMPSYQIGYVKNGKAYVNNQPVKYSNLPSSFYSQPGLFIYGYAPNQWGYLVFSATFLSPNNYTNIAEYQDYWGNSNGLGIENNDLANILSGSAPPLNHLTVEWQETCPSGYTNLSNSSEGTAIQQTNGIVNFCINGWKSDLTPQLISSYAATNVRIYGVDQSLNSTGNSTSDCAVIDEGELFSPSVQYEGSWELVSQCSTDFPGDSQLDSEFQNVVNRYMYTVPVQLWDQDSATPDPWGPSGTNPPVSWLQNNMPITQYPQPNVFLSHGITVNLNNKYYQIVMYYYRFYTGQGCSPFSLGISGKSSTTGFSYPPQAQIWNTGYEDPFNQQNGSLAPLALCSSSLLNGGPYYGLNTSARYTGSAIIVNVSSSPSTYYTVPIAFSPNGRQPATSCPDGSQPDNGECTFDWNIPTPIVN